LSAALLWLGFLLGLRHALEADHVTAVATLASRNARTREVVRIAGAWGLGHAVVLFAAGAALVYTGARWPEAIAETLELASGAVLVWLGLDVLRRATRPTSATEAVAPTFAARALVIGGVHGIEGSGAVVLLALPSLHSTRAALAYLAVFGMGSVAGMLACSCAVTLPLGVAARHLGKSARGLQLALGATSIAVGAAMIVGYMRSILM
jgi:hypothetical protein